MEITRRVKKSIDLTEEAFNRLLDWLHADRQKAGIRYEEIRLRLIKIFVRRGATCAEELADETINRVADKVAVIGPTYQGDPLLYFYGVAQNVFLEYTKKKTYPLAAQVAAPVPEAGEDYECLTKCLNQLQPESRWLILEYYREEKYAKINHRKALAARLAISTASLRMRAHRIKATLKECILDCLGTKMK